MKKNLFFVGLMLALTLSASAQDEGFSFGLKLGPNFNWTGSRKGAADNLGVKTGFELGFAAEYYFSENYALVSGVNIGFLGGKYGFTDKRDINLIDTSYNYQLGTVSREYKTTLFEIPLMFKMVTPEIGNIPLRAYAQLGGAFGITPRVKVKDTFTYTDVNDDDFRVAKGEYNPFHASLRIGAGAQYEFLDSMRAFLGIYYSYDFLNSVSSGVQGLTNNYRKYYNGDKNLGAREIALDVHQQRIGIEVGILF